MDILVVGSVAYDSVTTPESSRESQLGGSATYFSISASYFARVGVVAVVGDDFAPADRALLEARGIDTSGLETAHGGTFRWVGEYQEDLNTALTLETQLNVFADFNPRLKSSHASAPNLFLANIEPRLQRSVLAQMSGRPALVACDTMNLWIDISKPDLIELIREADALLINEAEARQLTAERAMVSAAGALLDFGLKTLVIKRGEYGMAVFNRDFIFAVPAYPSIKVVDPTGAGDAFAGGFMGYLAAVGRQAPEDLRCAGVAGSVMASFTVESFGIERLASLTPDRIQDRFRAFSDLTSFDTLSGGKDLPLRGVSP